MMLFVSTLIGFNPVWGQNSSFNVNQISYLDIDSAITPATLEYLQTQLKNIPPKSLIVIRMNTPGGLVTTTKDIIAALDSHQSPKVIWVTPAAASAASAGAIISAVADFIVMSPGTTIGAATPVGISEDLKESDGKNKVLNDLIALVSGLAEHRGRDPRPFIEMISQAKSFSDSQALQEGISLGSAQSTQDIIDLLQNKTFRRKEITYALNFSLQLDHQTYSPNLYQSVLSILAQPQLAYILFLLGIALIYFELQAPGGYIAGGLGVTSLIIAAISFQVLPLNWGAMGLIILGFILFILEIYIISYGLLSIGGIISLTLGSLFLFQTEHALIMPPQTIILSTLFSILLVMAGLTFFLFRTRKKNDYAFFSPLGKEGVVLKTSKLLPQVKIEGQIWNAVSIDPLEINDRVIVIGYDNQKLEVIVSKITRS